MIPTDVNKLILARRQHTSRFGFFGWQWKFLNVVMDVRSAVIGGVIQTEHNVLRNIPV